MAKDFIGCDVMVYDKEKKLIATKKILGYEAQAETIEVSEISYTTHPEIGGYWV